MKPFFFVLALVMMGTVACKRDKGPATPAGTVGADTAGPSFSLGAYPLNVGHMWVYDNGDTIRAMADTTINSIHVTRLTKTNAHYSGSIYCANLSDGLRLVACDYSSNFESLVTPVLDNPSGLHIPDMPVQCTMLPVNFSTNWEAHVPQMEHSPRQWLMYATVTTRAGTFNCVKLTAGYFDEYYSDKGIVKIVDHPNCIMAPCPDIITRLVYVNF